MSVSKKRTVKSAAKSKADMMKEMRAERKKAGLVRRDVWVHVTRVDDLRRYEKRLQTPKLSNK